MRASRSAAYAPANLDPELGGQGFGQVEHCGRWLGLSRRAFDMTEHIPTRRAAREGFAWLYEAVTPND